MERQPRMSKIVRPLPKGQITIPAEFRRRLGIDEETLLTLTLQDGSIEIRPVRLGAAEELRDYSEEDIARFLAEDKIDQETAVRVRKLLGEQSI